jgi:hypothetical protein
VIEADGLVQVVQFNTTRVYRNFLVQPRAWVETNRGEEIPVASLEILPNSISLTADGPGTIVLSEIVYPGWQARVEGQPAAMLEHGFLRAVAIGPGTHEVEFVYRPASVFVGLGLFLVGAVLVVILVRTGVKP